jgi:glycerophosphoryl diester phosphodiesterase
VTRTFDNRDRSPVERVPIVLAHQGASRAAAGNTLDAFRLAAGLGADGVELDVRRTSDGALVVHHDAAIGGTDVVGLTAAQLLAAHPEMPTLDEALDAVEGLVNIEIKNLPTEVDYDPQERVAQAVARTVSDRGLTERVVVSSFTVEPLDAVRAVDAHIRTGWLTLPSFAARDAVPLAQARGYDALHPERTAVLRDPGVVHLAHDVGLAINVWTVDDPDEIATLARAGVDAIITNVPDVARRALTASRG